MKIKARAWVRRIILLLVLVFGHISLTSLLIGLGCVFIGMCWHFWAIGALVRNKQLTTWGPYRFVRHPFYFANMIIDIGICVAGANYYVGAAYILLFYWAYYRRMKQEEAHLTGLFPDAYPQYMKQVPRFIPLWFKRFSSGQETGFSWRRIKESGNEFARISRLILHPLVLYIQMRRFPTGLYNLYKSSQPVELPGDIVTGIIGYQEIIVIIIAVLLSVVAYLVHRPNADAVGLPDQAKDSP